MDNAFIIYALDHICNVTALLFQDVDFLIISPVISVSVLSA